MPAQWEGTFSTASCVCLACSPTGNVSTLWGVVILLLQATYAQRSSKPCVIVKKWMPWCLWMIGELDVVNTCAEDGASPLFLAAQEGHVNCIKLLLQHGADANLATTDPVALPLHAALQFNHIRWVPFHLDSLANLPAHHCEGCNLFY